MNIPRLPQGDAPQEFDRLFAELQQAQTRADEMRTTRVLTVGFGDSSRAENYQAQQASKDAQRDLQRSKDNICAWLLANKDKVTVQA